MKVVKDTMKDADVILRELMDFMDVASELRRNVGPWKKYAEGRAMPRFIAETAQGATKALVGDFEVAYPTLRRIIFNGEGTHFERLHDACFKFGNVQKEVYQKRGVITDDATRQRLERTLNEVIGDIAIFIMNQFQLYTGDDSVTMAVQKICEMMGITKDSLYGLMLQEMRDSGQTWYSYEQLSPMYTALQEFDSAFAEECDANDFPLTDDLAEKLVTGEVDLLFVRQLMLEKTRSDKEEEVDVTPATLLSQMKLG